MGGRAGTIFLAIVLGGGAGAGAIVLLSRAPVRHDQRVEGRSLREWAMYLDDEADVARRDAAWKALPQFPPEDTIEPLIEALGGQFTAQQRAIAQLVKLQAAAVPPLMRVVRDDASSLRASNAIETLRLIGPPASASAADVIATRVGDPIAGGKAVQYFAQHGVPRSALAEAAQVLERVDGTARIHAINVLTLSPGDERALALLAREAQRDIGDGADAVAFATLCKLKNPPPLVIDAIAANLAVGARERDARRALLTIGVPAAPALAKLASHPNLHARTAAVEVLLGLGRNVKPIEKALAAFEKDPDSDVRLLAERGGMPNAGPTSRPTPTPRTSPILAILKPPATSLPVVDVIAAGEDDEDPYLTLDERARLLAINAVRDRVDTEEAILAAMSVKDLGERCRLIRLLPMCRDATAALEVMTKALGDDDVDVRRAAVTALRRMLHSPRAVEPLISALHRDASPSVRADAADALAMIAYQPNVNIALTQAAGDGDTTVAAAARAALKRAQQR
jgi:HEAT repeat protein